MTIAVLIYQFIIAAIVIVAGFKSQKACLIVAIGMLIWTLTHIFAPWLMLLQFVTIGIAYAIGSAMSRNV